MKHKTFSKENEKKLKQIIRAQRDEIRRLEVEIRELKKELLAAGRPKKPRSPKKEQPVKEAQPPKQVEKPKIKPKTQTPMTAEQRAAFCSDFSKRFKQSQEKDGKSESED